MKIESASNDKLFNLKNDIWDSVEKRVILNITKEKYYIQFIIIAYEYYDGEEISEQGAELLHVP